MAAYMILSSVASRAEHFLDDAAAARDQDTVRDRQDFRQVGRDHDHRLVLAASLRIAAWICGIALTSTPRVGSSKMTTVGSWASDLPTTTFC